MNQSPFLKFIAITFSAMLLFNSASSAIGQTNEPTVGMKPAHLADQNLGELSDNADSSRPFPTNVRSLWGPETILALAVLVFCLIIFAAQFWLIVVSKADWTPNTIIRFFGLTLVINSGVLLVVAGFSSQQIAGVLGLLGSIAGYLLGASSKGSTDGDSLTVATNTASPNSSETGSN